MQRAQQLRLLLENAHGVEGVDCNMAMMFRFFRNVSAIAMSHSPRGVVWRQALATDCSAFMDGPMRASASAAAVAAAEVLLSLLLQ